MVAELRRVLALSLICVCASAAGLLVYREGGKLRFVDILELEVNGKDKVVVLGKSPVPEAAINRLPSARLGATMIMDGTVGVPAIYAKSAAPQYLYPEGIPKNAAPAPEAWKLVQITYKKPPPDKSAGMVQAAGFVAYLAGGVDELAAICTDAGALKLLGGSRAFDAQIELTSAAVAAYGSAPAMAEVERSVARAMHLRLERFERGIDSAASLDEGLGIARLSAQAYPGIAEHERYRAQLAEKKRWLDRRAAVLSALAAGEQWDAFLVAYRDFELHQPSFPAFAKLHQQALKASLDSHRQQGNQRLKAGNFRRAFEQYRLASLRQPSDSTLQKDLSIAWAEYSRQAATAARQARPVLTAGQRDAITQSLHFAERYREQKKPDEAMKHIADAERIDPNSLPVLLAKAEALASKNEYAAALKTLDVYDLHAVDEERTAGAKLRNELLFQLTAGLDDLVKRVEAAWTSGRYHEALRLARQGLQADPGAPALLRRAANAALVTRDRQGGADLLKRYLAASNNLDSDAAQRSAVHQVLSSIDEPGPVFSEGQPHWFSGVRLPPDAFYCPVSLAFQPKIDRIAGSNKFSLRYTWEGERLASIVPAFEKGAPDTGEKPVVFTYQNGVPHAVAVDQGVAPRPLPSDPDQVLQSSNVVLPNTALIDPAMAARLADRQVTLTVAGNRFFHPFVWEKPIVFAVDYDSMGRVRTARQLKDDAPDARPPVEARFSWDGLRLTSIRVHQPVEGIAEPPVIYERTMRYEQGRLVKEQIRAGGRSPSIEYKWRNGQLISAVCDKDETLDGRSREVFFLAPAGQRAN